MLQGKHILVVEREFLVAMDLQHMLESAGVGPIIFARRIDEVASIHGRLGGLDLAIIETAPDIEAPALIDRLRAVGVAVVATTAGHGSRNVPTEGPVISKPVREAALLAACAEALAAR
jgi:hypothetical protein